jgi:2-oxoglutarate dehydrogenase complex dehydrogenase (E1) component-like enzyme
MATGHFHEVLDDPTANPKKVDTLVLCSGKFYYELKEKAEEMGVENMAFRACGTIVSYAGSSIENRFRKIQRRKTLCVGSGRAGQHGRMAVHGDEPSPHQSWKVSREKHRQLLQKGRKIYM